MRRGFHHRGLSRVDHLNVSNPLHFLVSLTPPPSSLGSSQAAVSKISGLQIQTLAKQAVVTYAEDHLQPADLFPAGQSRVGPESTAQWMAISGPGRVCPALPPPLP